MANELNIPLDPVEDAGLTITAKVRQPGGAQVGSDVAMTEPVAGFYTGNFSLAAVPNGLYSVEFINAVGRLVGRGSLAVAGNAEATLPAIKSKTDGLTFVGEDVKATLDGEQVVASNMRGTDDALPAASYAAPDNTGIADIKTIVTQNNKEIRGNAAISNNVLTVYDPDNPLVVIATYDITRDIQSAIITKTRRV